MRANNPLIQRLKNDLRICSLTSRLRNAVIPASLWRESSNATGSPIKTLEDDGLPHLSVISSHILNAEQPALSSRLAFAFTEK